MANKDRDNLRFERMAKELCQKNAQYPELIGFMNWARAAQTSRRTIYYYLVYITGFLNQVNKPITEISMDDYTIYAINQQTYSSSNQIAKYSAIKKFSEYLFLSDKIKKDFMTGIKRPKFVEKQETIQKRERGYLTTTEIQMVIANIQNGIRNGRMLWIQDDYRSRDMAIVLLFLSTGIRSIALQNLDVNDVDLDNNTIIVMDKGDKVNIHQIPEDTKTIIKKWLIKREELLKKANKETETALFISNRKTRISYDGIKKIVCKYCNNVTGKNITPHKLRATYGTMLYNKTHDIEFVREQMNHSSVVTTQRYIRGNGISNRQKAADIIGAVIANRKEPEDLFKTEEAND